MSSARSIRVHPAEWESRRLADLAALDLLDSAPEQRFDHLTALVAELLGVPVALVSLVDADRQWFKSRVGVEVTELPRELSLCTHAICVPEGMVVEDARTDPRFADNPLVTGTTHLRAYAGAVLHGPSGMPLGTLCAIDVVPRSFSERERRALRRVADLVEIEIADRATAHARANQRIADAYTDPVTGIPTERYAVEHLAQWVASGATGRRVAVRIRIERMVEAASAFGLPVVHGILRQVAANLTAAAGLGATVARGTGGTFSIVSGPVSDLDEAARWLAAIDAATRVPVSPPAGRPFVLSHVHVGAAVAPDDGGDAQELFERAALSSGFWRREIEARITEDYRLELRLREAITDRVLHLEYQPKFDLASGALHGAEALCRWQDPVLGNVPPGRFVPVAEGAGLVHALGELVLELACAQIRLWLDDGIRVGRVAVNISPTHLLAEGFVDRVTAILEHQGLDGSHLDIEITEGALAGDLPATVRVMGQLRELGIEFAIDDFGTGYSSLSYLTCLPVAALKIDRSFVSDLDRPQNLTLVKTIVQMAHALGMVVIAEGVETVEQADRLRAEGCEFAQGYLFSRPVRPSVLAAMHAPPID